MQYLANFEEDADGKILVTFPGVPEAITQGDDIDDARDRAAEVLESALLIYAEEGKPFPAPTERDGVDVRPIFVSAQTMAKLSLLSAFKQSGMTRVALAKELGKGETEIRRMLDPFHATKLPAIEEALKALGKRIVLTVEAA